jgi:Uncharacterized conserved protein
MTAAKTRIASVDIFRALTMLIMLWVNDFAGMANTPHWLHHAAMDEDMLGFSDLVFPAFLFCVGMSIPFAIRTRYRKGDSHLQVLLHIAVRTIALLIMGVFAMNMRGVEGGLSHSVFTLLAVAGYFLLWNVYPKVDGRNPWWVKVLKLVGAALLIFLVIYKDCHGMPFRVGWWGILGLIGWSYLACALIYVFTQGKFRGIAIAWGVAILLCVLNSASFIPKEFSSRAIILGFYPGGWTHIALTASGMLASAMLIRFVEEKADKDEAERRKSVNNMLIYLFIIGVAMFCLGMVSHKFWIISKIQATPTWLFFCTAIYFPLFALLYWIADVKGKTSWARPISPAGTATLTCYTIPYIWYAVQQLIGAHWPAVLSSGALGLVRSMVFAFIIIFLTWLFGKCRIKMKI